MQIKTLKNKGMTLVEALIWMAISGAVIVSAFVMYSGFRQEQKADIVVSELDFFSKNLPLLIHNTTYTEMTKGALKPETLSALGFLPETVKLVNDTTQIRGSTSQFGTVIIGQLSSKPGSLSVTFDKVPTGKICYRIIKSQANNKWDSINNVPLKSINNFNTFSACDTNQKTVELRFIMTEYSPTDLNAED